MSGSRPNTDYRVDLDYQNIYGQPAYWLEAHYGVNVYNNGISGNTTEQVRARWRRDALAENDAALNPSLSLNQKPDVIFLNVGIKDLVYHNISLDVMKKNYLYFASTAKESNIKLAMSNVGPAKNAIATQHQNIMAINEWLSTEFKDLHPEVILIDFMGFATGGGKDP